MGNFRRSDAEPNDYYATEPRAVELLLEQESFSELIWEPACGEGHISKVLEEHGHSPCAILDQFLCDAGVVGSGGKIGVSKQRVTSKMKQHG